MATEELVEKQQGSYQRVVQLVDRQQEQLVVLVLGERPAEEVEHLAAQEPQKELVAEEQQQEGYFVEPELVELLVVPQVVEQEQQGLAVQPVPQVVVQVQHQEEAED